MTTTTITHVYDYVVSLRDVIGWIIAAVGWGLVAGGWYVSTRIASSGWRKSSDIAAEGWKRSGEIAAEGWRRSEETSRKAIEMNEDLRTAAARNRLIRRIHSTLDIGEKRLGTAAAGNPATPISVDSMRIIGVLWSRYDRVADDLWLLGDADLEEHIDLSCIALKNISDRIIAEETQYAATRRELGEKNFEGTGIEVHPNVEKGIQEHRAQVLVMVGLTRAHVRASKQMFEAKFPPPRNDAAVVQG